MRAAAGFQRRKKRAAVLFCLKPVKKGPGLFALSALMPRAGQQLSVLVFAHLFTSFFHHTAQGITSHLE